MIITLILMIILTLINFLLARLPASNLPDGFTSAVHDFLQSGYQFNSFLPIDTAYMLLAWTATFWGMVGIWYIIKWVIHLFRGN